MKNQQGFVGVRRLDGVEFDEEVPHSFQFPTVTESEDQEIEGIQDESPMIHSLKDRDGAFQVLDRVAEVTVLVVNETDQIETDPFEEGIRERTGPEFPECPIFRIPLKLKSRAKEPCFRNGETGAAEPVEEFPLVCPKESEGLEEITPFRIRLVI
jgi:hypothetical protein